MSLTHAGYIEEDDWFPHDMFPAAFFPKRKGLPPSTASSTLINGGATPVGQWIIYSLRLARTLAGEPFKLFVTATARDFEFVKSLGADFVVGISEEHWPEKIKKLSDGGIEACVDCISFGPSLFLFPLYSIPLLTLDFKL